MLQQLVQTLPHFWNAEINGLHIFPVPTLTLLNMLSQLRVARQWLCPNSDKDLFFHPSGSTLFGSITCAVHTRAHQICCILDCSKVVIMKSILYACYTTDIGPTSHSSYAGHSPGPLSVGCLLVQADELGGLPLSCHDNLYLIPSKPTFQCLVTVTMLYCCIHNGRTCVFYHYMDSYLHSIWTEADLSKCL